MDERLSPRREVARFDKVGAAALLPLPKIIPSYVRHLVNIASNNNVSLRMIANCFVFWFVSRNMLNALSGT